MILDGEEAKAECWWAGYGTQVLAFLMLPSKKSRFAVGEIFRLCL